MRPGMEDGKALPSNRQAVLVGGRVNAVITAVEPWTNVPN